MKIIIALLVALLGVAAAAAQTATRPRSVAANQPPTLLSDNARFELVKLSDQTIAPVTGAIVRLDRYTGRTHYYSIDSKRRWALLGVRGGLPDETGNTTPKYQIFDDGSSIFLLNNDSGQSWILTGRAWEPVAD